MIRRFGRAGARARAMQERREIAAAGQDGLEHGSRLIGRCTLCDNAHAFPDLRDTCPRCGVEVCFRGRCECGRAVK